MAEPLDKEKSLTATEKEDTYIMALHDMCARIDLAVSEIMNVITNLNNTKNYYLKFIGQIRQEQQKAAASAESISSK
jgi:adenine-specific DNA glycosylase